MTVVGTVDTLPVKEFRRLDLNSEELGVSVHELMGHAGKALAQEVRDLRSDEDVVLLCGKGNNGGDGFAAAAKLIAWGIPTIVVLMEPGRPPTGAAGTYLDALPSDCITAWKGSRRSAWRDALVVDCMLGSGIQGKPRPPYDAAIRWVNGHRGKLVACDIPSGLGTPLSLRRPDVTVTFHAAKEGMTGDNSGEIRVASIGIPRDAARIGRGDLDAGFVRSKGDSHKGDNGRVLVVGGGPFIGAPFFSGKAALRSGADLVHVATTDAAAAVMQTWGPDLLVHGVGEGMHLAPVHEEAIAGLLDRVDVIVLGPGIGTAAVTRELASRILTAAAHRSLGIVVDADGLDAVDDDLLARHGERMVLTPHGKEFQDLSGWKATRANVTRYAREHGVTVLCKGEIDVVAGPDTTRTCRRGHPAMTVGGTGDVLAGVVASFMARGAAPFDAACAAAYLNGAAGELAAEMRSYGMTASDLVESLPAVLRTLD